MRPALICQPSEERAEFQSRASSIGAESWQQKLPATTAPQATSRCGVLRGGSYMGVQTDKLERTKRL
jgi:hypothetical protein